MKILALDSSGLVASVALVEDDILVAEYTMNYKKTHSQTLLPMLDEIKKAVNLDLESIDAIAVAAGPGSFTGLRIGSATAKGLGLALQKPLIGVPTVEALAYMSSSLPLDSGAAYLQQAFLYLCRPNCFCNTTMQSLHWA